MLESQYAPARDDHENLDSLVESGLSFWKQAKSNAKEVGPRRMKGLFPGRWEGISGPQRLLSAASLTIDQAD